MFGFHHPKVSISFYPMERDENLSSEDLDPLKPSHKI
jgi:hypothetical protein